MAKKTYYPTFRAKCEDLQRYIHKYGAAMQTRTGIIGTTFAAELTTLDDSLSAILLNWPAYTELP